MPSDALPQADPLVEVGSMLGEYEVVGLLGEGGFGRVYKARHPVIGKMAAVKVLNRQYSSNPQMVSRFITEARAVNQIKHPNIVDIFSFGALADGRRFLAMELLEGSTLDGLLARGRAIELPLAITVLRGVGMALDAAHAVGIIHRDLKPENVFLAIDSKQQFTPKLLDFGIAKLTGDGVTGSTKTGTIIGTPQYMSPEQARGKQIDARSDIYSFGVVAYEMLTGCVPFEGDNPADLVLRQSTSEARPPSAVNNTLPYQLDAPLMAMLSSEPSLRPASASEALVKIEASLREAGVQLSEMLTFPELGPRPSRRVTPEAPTLDAVPVLVPEARGAVSSQGDPGATSKTPPPSGAPARGRAPLWFVGAALLLGGGLLARGLGAPPAGALASAVVSASAQAPSAGLTSAVPPASAAPLVSAIPAAAPLSDEIEVSVQGAPAGALVRGQGKLLGEAPGPFKVRRGAVPVSLTISAAGYRPVELSLVPTANVVLSAPLQRADAPAGPKKAATPKELDNPFR